MATKKVTTATAKDVTAKVTAPVTKTSEKAETTKKAETVKAVAATEPKKIEKEPVKTAAPKAEPVKPTTKEETAKPEAKNTEKKVEDKAVKTATKKTATKKTTAKKTTARKTTAKKEIKVSAFVEYFGKQVEEKDMIARVKKAWTSSGKKIGDIKTMELYIKPEESAVYYVINGTETGAVAF